MPGAVFSLPKLSLVKTFCVSEYEIPVQKFRSSFDLHVIGLTGERKFDTTSERQTPESIGLVHSHEEPSAQSANGTDEGALSSRCSRQYSLGSTAPTTAQDSMHPPRPSAELQSGTQGPTIFYGALMSTPGLSDKSLESRAASINSLRLRQGLQGVVLSYSRDDSAGKINTLLIALKDLHVSVILKGDPDLDIVDSISFALIDGFMIQNACILPDGQRRDFFRAVQVRECIARCKRQMEHRPDFFMGFLEVWMIRPSAATLRRAFKLADFFGAVIQVQAVSQNNTRIEMSLSGFDWLKRPEIVNLQKCWSQNPVIMDTLSTEVDTTSLNTQKLSEVLSPAENLLSLAPLPPDLLLVQNERLEDVSSPKYVSDALRRDSIWNVTSCGASLCKKGCYNLRDEITQEQYERILQTQRRLKDLHMLQVYADIEIMAISKVLNTTLKNSSYPELLQKLLDKFTEGRVRIYRGLDSGFGLPDDGGHMIGLSDNSLEYGHDVVDIYISLKNAYDAATIWHVFLAHNGIGRLQCYEEELLFFPGAQLPKSLQQELGQCTEAELLSIIQQIRLSKIDHTIHKVIVETCVNALLEDSRRSRWTALHSRACLDGSLSMRTLIQMRLEHFAKQGARQLPELDKLVELSELLARKFQDALFATDRPTLNQLSAPLIDAYNTIGITRPSGSVLDLYGLIYFCVLRKLAFEDVYIETTDRCPLFLQQRDQAGVFSELWVLGSQCKIYFGIQPRALGEVIYDRYYEYLSLHPPPPNSWDGKDVFTAYSNTEARIKLEGHGVMTGSGSPVDLPGQAPGFKLDEPESTKYLVDAASTFGALSIFCFPAMIDVLLLTFVGRGLYLTVFMDPRAIQVANYAILTALLMTGGITGWVGSTGGFYLYNFAFDNMSYFIVQRFSAAFVLTTIVALCGFFAFGAQVSWFDGFVYLIYLYALTTFLNLLGMFATMHRLGCPLTSGRTAMWRCIPILFISPILTTFVNGHDLLIYLLIIYTFVIALLFTFRNLLHEWTTWLAKVPSVKEKDLLAWYNSKMKKEQEFSSGGDSQEIAARARLALRLAVHEFRNRSFFRRAFNPEPEIDPFVKKMGIGHPYALWLLEKEALGAELPAIYTTTWFVQLELAFTNQRQLVRGLKEHSQFITFRYSKYDLGQNVGLFLGALMDRWIDLVMSARRPEIVTYFDDRARYGICFGVLYFLFGAVAVDLVLQKYWPLMDVLPGTKIADLDAYAEAKVDQQRARNKHYRNALMELLTYLAIDFGVVTILLLYRSMLVSVQSMFYPRPKSSCGGSAVDLFYDFVIGLNITSVSASIATFFLTGCFSSLTIGINGPMKNIKRDRKKTEKGPSTSAKSQVNLWATLFQTQTDTLCNLSHTTHRKILQHLCLDIDVNLQWTKIPDDVRSLVISRVLGDTGHISAAVRTWLAAESKSMQQFDTELERCLHDYESKKATISKESDNAFKVAGSYRDPELTSVLGREFGVVTKIKRCVTTVGLTIFEIVKWTALISGGASDANRELWFALRNNPARKPLLWILLKVWKACWFLKNFFTYLFLILGKPSLSSFLEMKDRGLPRTLHGNTITVDTPFSKITGFLSRDGGGNLLVSIFDGIHKDLPESQSLRALAFYDEAYRVVRYETDPGSPESKTTSTFEYENKEWKRWPSRRIVNAADGPKIESSYDKHGRVVSGKLFRGDAEFSFEFVYQKRPKGNAEILGATYTQENAEGTSPVISVYWSVQPRSGSEKVENWTPSDKIRRLVAKLDGQIYETKWVYKHARDPDLETTITKENGMVLSGVDAPAAILEDKFGLLEKPKDISFDHIDLLVHHPLRWLARFPKHEAELSKPSPRFMSLVPFGYSENKKKVVRQRVPTSVLRTALWTSWAKPPYLDAVSACFLDEMILRKEPLLKRYWDLRDAGHLVEAAHVLDENLDLIKSAIKPSAETSQTCPLLIKVSDLFVMGLGKDANQVTARPEDAYHDTPTQTSVIFSDNGCWPDNPGGVSNCRRDLVNGHHTIRGHCLAESANDFGIPRYQIENNINSLKILPLWGLDGKTAYHGVLDNLLQTQIDERIYETRVEEDIKGIFIPLLTSFVKGARMRHYTRGDLIIFSNLILQMNRFFEKCDFNKTWNHKDVWDAWVQAWLIDYQDPNIGNFRDCLEIEQASLSDFKDALGLYICYFFIYSVELPAECPTVFQSTHHGISSLFGMLLKHRRGTTWGIWDHAILWRETCLNISPAQCLLPIPVQSMLLAGVKLACHLAYTHVDIVLPCTSVFNPDWEADLGTDQGLRGSKKLFARKIDPIVNGIGNMDAFQPVAETRSKLPTCVMLSNVQFIKDVKNAVLAADVIVNKYGFTDYRLLVYGAQDRQPSYALETTTLINTRNLSANVTLAGFGSPKEVLKDAWLFMNSSLSEGLPLAIGEAALSGIPIVATEVGATALVLTDPDDPTRRYGEVVPPNDPEALARAQLSILSMLGPWAQYTTDKIKPPPLPDIFKPEDVAWILARMYEKAEDRRALGLRLRDVVLRSFHGQRYLREHEQMYWIQRCWSETRRSAHKLSRHPPANAAFGESNIFEYDDAGDTGEDAKARWQDFQLDLLKANTHPPPRTWQPLYDALNNNPQVTFDIIVNPNNGPGGSPPDSNYIANISQLNTYSNVNMLGYVHTSYGNRSLSAISSDIDTYQRWSTYTNYNISLGGIFVDESPTTMDHYSYMATIYNKVKRTMKHGNLVWTNPGVPVDSSFYKIADMINAYENTYDAWMNGGNSSIPQAQRSKSTIMLHSYPSGTHTMASDVDELVDAGYYAGLLIVNDQCSSFDSMWPTFCSEVGQSNADMKC
ncbi:glycosyltransferase family 4 protein, partial [Aureobasidium melanogenum]